jgi:hypothetical protein
VGGANKIFAVQKIFTVTNRTIKGDVLAVPKPGTDGVRQHKS